MKTCKVDGCEKGVAKNGMCGGHNWRNRKYGSPNGGGVARGSLKKFAERQADKSRRIETDDCVTWPYSCNVYGYAVAKINGKMVMVSRFICEEEYGPPPSSDHHAAHSCGRGNKGCINYRHPRWATALENIRDKTTHGTAQFGETGSRAILKERQVMDILGRFDTSTPPQMAREYGVHVETIRAILKRKTWKHIAAPSGFSVSKILDGRMAKVGQ